MMWNNIAGDWDAISAIGTILGALATFLACWIALWQTYSNNRKKLKIEMREIELLVGTPNNYCTYVEIRITNVCMRPIEIKKWNISGKNAGKDEWENEFENESGYILKKYFELYTPNEKVCSLDERNNPDLPYMLGVDENISFYCEFKRLERWLIDATEAGSFKRSAKINFNFIDSSGRKYSKKYLKNAKTIINHLVDNLRKSEKKEKVDLDKKFKKLKKLRRTILKNDGVKYIDFVAQLTYLLFIKTYYKQLGVFLIPEEFSWDKLKDLSGENLKAQYNRTLVALSKMDGMIGVVFVKAQNIIEKPSNLKSLVSLVDEGPWPKFDDYHLDGAYRHILEENVRGDKSDAGQYFTPRLLTRAIVDVMRPTTEMALSDPACGTGSFLIDAYHHMWAFENRPPKAESLSDCKVSGNDINPLAVNLCAMNLHLNRQGRITDSIKVCDTLIKDEGLRYDMVLTHLPFSSKLGASSNENVEYNRVDFIIKTDNKQINFLQHIMTILNTNGRAAVVVPDRVLFEGGACEELRKRLLNEFDLHTILRLPTEIFYEKDVKAHVLFFTKLDNGHRTDNIWIYDSRTNNNIELLTDSFNDKCLEDFVSCYQRYKVYPREESERFKKYTYDEVMARDKTNLDITWILANRGKLEKFIAFVKGFSDKIKSFLVSFKSLVKTRVKRCIKKPSSRK